MSFSSDLRSAISHIENALSYGEDISDSVLVIALAYVCRTDQSETEITRVTFDYDKIAEAVKLARTFREQHEDVAAKVARTICRKAGVTYDD